MFVNYKCIHTKFARQRDRARADRGPSTPWGPSGPEMPNAPSGPCGTGCTVQGRRRANLERISQSRPDSGLDLAIFAHKILSVVSFSLGSVLGRIRPRIEPYVQKTRSMLLEPEGG